MMTSQTIGRQVRAAFALALALTLVLALAAAGALAWVSRVQDDVVGRGLELLVEAEELQGTVAERAVAIRNFLLTGDERYAAAVDDDSAETTEFIGTLGDMVRDERAVALLAEIDELDDALRRQATAVMAARRTGLGGDGLADVVASDLQPPLEQLTSTIDELVRFEQGMVDDGVEAVRRSRNIALLAFGILAAAAIGLTALTSQRITRRTTGSLSEVSHAINGASNEILTVNRQQVSGASEQASAIQETAATVDELAQSADETTRRARDVVTKTETSVRTAEEGSAAVQDATEGMAALRDQVNDIAETILSLARQAQSISGIVDTVDDIAEQTNLLALNAAIEAARAGEHGRGFSVVATEIRDLADQSRKATAEIGGMLGHIQDATNKAVMATEEGSRGATSAMGLVSQAGTTISELAHTVDNATIAAEQIAAAAEQQAGAMGQIRLAMGNISDVMEQNQVSARQSEKTARDLNDVVRRLQALVGTV